MTVQTLRLCLTFLWPCEAAAQFAGTARRRGLSHTSPYFQASAPRRQRRPLLLHDPALALPAGAQGLPNVLPVHRWRVGTVLPRGLWSQLPQVRSPPPRQPESPWAPRAKSVERRCSEVLTITVLPQQQLTLVLCWAVFSEVWWDFQPKFVYPQCYHDTVE